MVSVNACRTSVSISEAPESYPGGSVAVVVLFGREGKSDDDTQEQALLGKKISTLQVVFRHSVFASILALVFHLTFECGIKGKHTAG